jgi:DNA-binding MarR family transcriptional regulator
MSSVIPPERDRPDRGQLNYAVRDTLRDLAIQLSLLTQRVGGRLDLKGTDLECLDLINRHGPISPGTLARLTGMHPATMTGVIDRLERGGWITRERDARDRRAVTVQVVRARAGDVLRLFGGMNSSLSRICADYPDAELDVIAGFLRRTADAAREATAGLVERG